MTVVETALIFAGIPLAVILVIFALVYRPGAGAHGRRYRPGRPFAFTPVWFLSRPEEMSLTGAGTDEVAGTAKALPAGGDRDMVGLVGSNVKGGASGSW